MAEYDAPLRDMKFVIKELAGLSEISALPGCEEATPDLVDAVLEEAGKFAAGALSPLNWSGDQQGCKLDDGVVTTAAGFKEAYGEFVAAGWTGLSGSPQWGGQGLPHIISGMVSEMWNSANMSACSAPRSSSPGASTIWRTTSSTWCSRAPPMRPKA
jgi:alkylation response protein AidB-like acyl-CoA dehydrogenase